MFKHAEALKAASDVVETDAGSRGLGSSSKDSEASLAEALSGSCLESLLTFPKLPLESSMNEHARPAEVWQRGDRSPKGGGDQWQCDCGCFIS